MAHVLTPGERQLVADHLRAGAHTAGRLAAIELSLIGLGVGAGLLVGTVVGTITNAVQVHTRKAVPQ